MSTPWRRAFSLRLVDAAGRLHVPWGWVLVGLVLMVATVTYDLTDSPAPQWLSQDAAVGAAERLLVQLPEHPEVDQSRPVVFVSDHDADAYANRLIAGQRGAPLPDALPIWAWRLALRGGRGYISVGATTGAVTGLDLGPAESLPVTAVASLDAAMTLANRVGVGGAGWEGPRALPGNSGTVYTWRSRQKVLGEAPEVAEITVQGGHAVRFRRYLDVPAAFRQALSAQEQRGNWIARNLLFWVEVAGMVAALILAIRWRRSAHWPFGLAAAAAVLVLAVVGGLNASLVSPNLQRSQIASGIQVAVLMLVLIGTQAVHVLWVLFGGAAGWALAKEQWGDRVALLAGNLRRLLALDGAVAGLRAYAVFVLQYQIAFWFYYFAERRLGVWQATGLSFAENLNQVLPLLYPLQVTIVAPLLEEITWRLFAVSALRRLFRLTFPAVLVPAIFWGLAHSWYQVYPPYTRALELSLVGLLLGYAFIHWGLEVTIGAHLLYNALVTCMGLALVPLPAQRAGAALAAALLLLPAVPVALQLWRQRQLSP